MNPMKLFGVGMIRLYRLAFFWMPSSCRFEPSCSRYAEQAIETYGVIGGGWMALKRLLRCHPWGSTGGFDPVP